MKRIKRLADGKVYEVLDTKPIVIAGIQIPHAVDVLVPGSLFGDDVLSVSNDGSQSWLDGFETEQ